MRAAVSDATWLAGSSVREEVNVSNWRSNAGTDNGEGRSIGVNTFDVLGISCVEATVRTIDAVENACWVQTDDSSDSASLNVLSGETGDVG